MICLLPWIMNPLENESALKGSNLLLEEQIIS